MTRVRVALVTSTMGLEEWRAALENALAAAGLDAEVLPWEGRPLDARYAVAWLPPRGLFETEPQLRAVFNLGAGVDAVLKRDLPTDVPLLRLVDVGMAAKMAEYVCFAVARITRGLDRFGTRGSDEWTSDGPRGRPPTVGVLGAGAIGAKIAAAARMFGYPARTWSRTPRPADDGIENFAGAEALAEFLRGTQILVNTLPLTAATENLLDRARLSQLPAGAHLINVGRGAAIVDADLIALLDSGHLASATLDVFRTEPLPPEHPFWHHPMVTVTPHLSGPTPLEPAAEQIAAMLVQLESGQRAEDLPGYVDRDRGY
jgi:glyoxylate/hydroxypyruvate reductase A